MAPRNRFEPRLTANSQDTFYEPRFTASAKGPFGLTANREQKRYGSPRWVRTKVHGSPPKMLSANCFSRSLGSVSTELRTFFCIFHLGSGMDSNHGSRLLFQ